MLIFYQQIFKFKETGEMFLSPYFTSEPTELTGLFVEKPPENVVAVSGLSLYMKE